MSLVLCCLGLVALPTRQTEACSCIELSPYDGDASPPGVRPDSDLFAFVSPPDGASEVQAQVVSQGVTLAAAVTHGQRADRHLLQATPRGRWPSGNIIVLQIRYVGAHVAEAQRKWTNVRSYRVLGDWWDAFGNVMGPPHLGALGPPIRGGETNGMVSMTSCGHDGPTLLASFLGAGVDTVLIYVDRAPAGFPDTIEVFRRGVHLTSGDQLCGSAVLQPGDLASGKTLWLVPVSQAGRRGEPVKVVVPAGRGEPVKIVVVP